MNDVIKVAGRIVSSPWPDRLETSILVKEDSGKYTITGLVMDVTSSEVVDGGVAAKIPVNMV